MCIKYEENYRRERSFRIRKRVEAHSMYQPSGKAKSLDAIRKSLGPAPNRCKPYLNSTPSIKGLDYIRVRNAVEVAAAKDVVKIENNPETPPGIETFINVMVHACKCKSCTQLSCRKMRIVLQHYIRCDKIVSGASCQVCQQLLQIITKHATSLCKADIGENCPVPLCDKLRRGFRVSNLSKDFANFNSDNE